MADQTLETIVDAVADVFFADQSSITAETVAEDVDGWDSVTHTIFIMELERRFAITIPLEPTFALKNLGELALFIEQCKGPSAVEEKG